jgi:hypothetical protein
VADVAARDGDDEAEVRVDHELLRLEIALLDAAGEIELLGGREQRVAARVAQEEVDGVVLELEVEGGVQGAGQQSPYRR